MVSAHSDSFSISRVIGRTLDVMRQNLIINLILGGALVVLPQALIAYVAGNDPANTLGVSFGNIISGLIALLAKAAMTYAAMRTLSGKSNTLGDTLSSGLTLYFPTFGIGFLTNIGVGLGLLLLIVPGLILMTWWCVALPARVAKEQDGSDALAASRSLTKGYRWHIAGLLGIAALILFPPPFFLGAVRGTEPGAGLHLIIDVGLLPIVDLFTLTTAAAATSAIYHELTRLKGGAVEETAEVFA